MSDKKPKIPLSKPLISENASGSDSGTTIGTRIGEIAEELGGNSALARMAEVSESVVRKWTGGTSEPTTSNLVAIARAGGVTVEWLATGVWPKHPGQMVSAEDYAFVPLYDVSASAGQGAFVSGEHSTDALAFKRNWLRQNVTGKVGDLAIINVRGDSMEPTLRDGDVIMVNKADTDVTDGIYVFLLDGWLMVKRLQRRVGEHGVELWAASEHPGYESFQLPPLEEFSEPTKIVGRVVWAGRRF